MMVSDGITKDGLSKSKVNSCGVCSLREKDKSYICAECDKLIHGRCARVKMVTAKLSRNFAHRKWEGIIGGSRAGRKVML